jgi:serine/threonine-protein kinase RIM15
MHMPVVGGEQVARMIRSTTNPNQNSPSTSTLMDSANSSVIAATAYGETITEEGTLFSAVIAKPFSKSDLIRCLSKVGFIISSSGGSDASPIIPNPA